MPSITDSLYLAKLGDITQNWVYVSKAARGFTVGLFPPKVLR